MKHLIDPTDLSLKEIDEILSGRHHCKQREIFGGVQRKKIGDLIL